MRFGTAIISIMCATLASAASAQSLTATYTGVIGNRSNGSALIGESYVSTYTFDISLLSQSNLTTGYDRYDGPIVATFTVNGVTQVIDGGSLFVADFESGGPRDLYDASAVVGQLGIVNHANLLGLDFVIGTGAFQSISADITGATSGSYFGGGLILELVASHLTVAESVPAVPEPATWAMMLVGFGAMGVALRRRRKLTNIAQLA